MYADTEENYQIMFAHQDKLIREFDPRWISIYDRLPILDEWVCIVENDRLDSHSYTWNRIYGHDDIRVITARLFDIDEEGNPYWYRGSSPRKVGRNVSHWMPLPDVPTVEDYPDE